MRRISFVFLFLFVMAQLVYGEEVGRPENSVCIYGAAITSDKYWAYPANISENEEPIRFPIDPEFRLGAGFDLGWGISRDIELLVGYNHFLRGSTADVKIEDKTYEGPESVSFSPIYVNIRYKSPFQLYIGCGINYSVIGLTDNSIEYAENGGFGFQGFGGMEMRGTSGRAITIGLFAEIGYIQMTGFTNDIFEGSLSKVRQKSNGIYLKVGVRKYL